MQNISRNHADLGPAFFWPTPAQGRQNLPEFLTPSSTRKTSHQPGVAQEGGGGGYHFASSAGLPKLDSTLEILFVTACASQSAQTAQSEGDLLLVCRQKGTSPSSAGRRGGGSLVCYPTLGVRQTRQSDSHFRLVLGLPYTITINIP